MDPQLISTLGAMFRLTGWAFLPVLALPFILLIFSKSNRLSNSCTALAYTIDTFSTKIGEAVKWLLVALVLCVSFGVIALSIFGQSNTKFDELATYFCALVILLGASSTLLASQHVRVDIIYSRLAPRGKALVDLIGFYVFMVPFCLILIWNAQSFIALAWVSFEGSAESDGLRGIFALKTSLSFFSVMILAQGLSIAIRAVLLLTGRPAPKLPDHIDDLFPPVHHIQAEQTDTASQVTTMGRSS